MIHDEIGAGGAPRSSSEIESDIRQTRSRMDSTLDQLGERLTARSLLNSALDWWESHSEGTRTSARVKDTYQTIIHQVKDNPMPAMLVGAGIAWMLIGAAREEPEYEEYERPGRMRYRGIQRHPLETESFTGGEAGGHEGEKQEGGPGLIEKAKDKLAEGKEAIAGAAETAKEKISGMGEAAQRATGEMRHRARESYSRGRSMSRQMGRSLREGYSSSAERFEDAVEEYPLAVGVGFAALGALVGLLLPSTRREDELLGESSDQLVENVKEKGQEILERGKVVGERVAGAAMEEAKKQGITEESVGEKLSEVAGKAGEVARRAKEEASTAAKEQKLTPEQLKAEASSATRSTSQQPPKLPTQPPRT